MLMNRPVGTVYRSGSNSRYMPLAFGLLCGITRITGCIGLVLSGTYDSAMPRWRPFNIPAKPLSGVKRDDPVVPRLGVTAAVRQAGGKGSITLKIHNHTETNTNFTHLADSRTN